ASITTRAVLGLALTMPAIHSPEYCPPAFFSSGKRAERVGFGNWSSARRADQIALTVVVEIVQRQPHGVPVAPDRERRGDRLLRRLGVRPVREYIPFEMLERERPISGTERERQGS